MSLQTWKDEFYPIPASKVSKKDAIQHSLQKWTGLLKKNLKTHHVRLSLKSVRDSDNSIFTALAIGNRSCALCKHYYRIGCRNCPLYAALGNVPCDEVDQPYYVFSMKGKVKPMIQALKTALKEYDNQ